MKVALVHEWLTNMAGSEKVVEQFLKLYPDAPIYTTMVNKDFISEPLKNARIIPSFLQKRCSKNSVSHQKYFPFMPMAFESFDLNDYDIVLSSSHSCAKGVVTPPNTMHVCYCHSPMRYGWEFYHEYTSDMGRLKKILVKYLMNYMRIWDVASSNRVDYFIANSENVAKRIWKHYRRESTVIYPPVDTEFYTIGKTEAKKDFFLCASRLVKYKRIDIAVQAFNELGLPLVIVGNGNEMNNLKKIAKQNIQFLGRISDETLRAYYRDCNAFIFPGEEDFGIAPVEAQACGRPVIAFGKGGALETVLEGETGLFFREQTVESLKDAVNQFQWTSFESNVCRKNAERFSIENFKISMDNYINDKYDDFKNNNSIPTKAGFNI